MAEEKKNEEVVNNDASNDEGAVAGIVPGLIDREITEEVQNAFLNYSMSVIESRAIPDVRDGLKPVQRRIIFGMNESGMQPGKPYKKCARIVGDVMGKYHPHGDSAIYGTLVRMAQPFAMRYCLADGHGNFGDVDGDEKEEDEEEKSEEEKTPLDVIKDKVDIHGKEDTIVIAEKGQLDNPEAPKIEVAVSEEEKEILEPEFHEEEHAEEETEEESAEEESVEEDQEELNESAKESDLSKKLKEHNDYIETLQDEIKKEEEAIKVAKNEFIKKLHENNLASLKAALDKAIPEEVKAEEAIDDLPTPEEAAEELPDSKTELTEQLDAKEMQIKESASEVSDSEIKELLNSEEFNTPISDEEVDRIIEDEKNLKEGKSKSVFEMLEDFDEVSMNSCMTKALTEVYSNVKNFEMTECSLNESSLVVEGKINFNSGKARETSFVFTEGKEPKVLCGINEDLDKDGSFNICYGIDNNKMFVESLKYSYHVENNLVEGLINR